MIGYQSQRVKIKKYIDGAILSVLNSGEFNNEIDYNKFLSCVVADLGVSKSMAEDCLRGFIESGKLVEHRTLLFPDDKEIKQETEEELDKILKAKPDGP